MNMYIPLFKREIFFLPKLNYKIKLQQDLNITQNLSIALYKSVSIFISEIINFQTNFRITLDYRNRFILHRRIKHKDVAK